MKRTLVAFCLAILLAVTAGAGRMAAQQDTPDAPPVQELYMPRNVQAAYDMGSRSPDGMPGPNYWQNKAVHDISITVAPPSPTISGTETITYTNNSPDYLLTVPVRLYMNVRLPEAQREENHSPEFLTSGVHIDEFRVDGEETPWAPLPGSGATFKAISLPQPLAPGESVNLAFTWHYDLATEYKHEGIFDPTTYFLAYFFPRITTSNDTDVVSMVPGFDTEEFTYRSGRERFDDFADFTVAVNVPKNFVVWATGDLQNPDEVLQPTYAQRLHDSLTSDEVVNIATPEEIQQGQVTTQTDTVTWKWQADNVTTFGIGLSDHYVWDAGSVVVDPATERRASVQAAYPVEASDYQHMVEDGKSALAFGSTQWPGVPYPYSKTTIFVGGGDEEFPMMANDSPAAPPSPGATVRFIAAHELLHSYFPFYMGIDERRYPMLDEGWTTAFEYLFGLEDVGQEQADVLFKAVRSSRLAAPAPGIDIPIITPADATRGPIASNNAYEKSALAYLALKEVMGEAAFKASLQEFINRWRGKHPLPWDMFNTFNDTSDEDLTWFFDNWFFEPNYIDLAVESVTQGAAGTVLTVDNVGGFAIPFDVNVVYADDSTATFRQNPAIWQDSPRTATIPITGTADVKAVTLDGGIFVETNQANNVWPLRPAVDPNARVVAQEQSPAGTASFSMTLPRKSQALGSGQYSVPPGVVVSLAVISPTITITDAIKQSAVTFNAAVEDAQIVDGGSIAGHPSKVVRTTTNLGGTEYGYDSYAFTTNAGTYQVVLLLPNAALVDGFRQTMYPGLLKTVAIEPKE
jgi:hypothetical protein